MLGETVSFQNISLCSEIKLRNLRDILDTVLCRTESCLICDVAEMN